MTLRSTFSPTSAPLRSPRPPKATSPARACSGAPSCDGPPSRETSVRPCLLPQKVYVARYKLVWSDQSEKSFMQLAGKRVLLVEDEPLLLLDLQDMVS